MTSSKSIPSQIPLPMEGSTVEIPLTRGYISVVDAIDADVLETHWSVLVDKKSRTEYAQCGASDQPTYLHQLILMRILDRSLQKGERVDHVDGNGLNNRRGNLRLATHQQNMHNQRLSRANTSGYKGVHWNKRLGKWQARIKIDGRKHHLGFFNDPVEAHKAYCQAATDLFGEFARFS